MKTPYFKKRHLVAAIGFSCLLMATLPTQAVANTSVRNEMQQMFGSMSNVTEPGVFETSRRGVISGGSIVSRNRIMNTNIVSWQPPSFSAGCGGVDLFAGSFSFVNKDQFVQLARTVASNAAGYAFYLALGAMCDDCRNIMDKLQAKIQKLNEMFSNSCQLAQGIVNDTARAMDNKRTMDAGTSKSFLDDAGDVFESFTEVDGTPPTEGLSASERDKITMNVVWKALQDNGVAGWFTYGGNNLNLAIMSATGTVVVGNDKPADAKGQSPERFHIPGGHVTLRQLTKGGDAQLIQCDTTARCLEPSLNSGSLVNITGFEEMVRNMLIGTSPGSGILNKMANNIALSSSERNFIANMPNSSGAMIFRLSRINTGVAKEFVQDVSVPFARDMAYEMLEAFIDAALTATRSQPDSSHQKEAFEVLNESREKLHQEYMRMSSEGPNMSDFVERYNAILKAAGQIGVTPSFSVSNS